MEESASNDLSRTIAAIALVVILGLHAAVVGHLLSRPLDHDEGEHLRAAEWVASGKTLYRDFVENHTPFLYLILARFAPTELDFDELRQYITNARLLSAAAGTAAAIAVALIAMRASGNALAAVTTLAALLARGWTYDRSVIDIRSEPFTLLLFWGGVLLIIAGEGSSRKRAILAGAGAALIGVSALWNPKWPLETAAIAVWYLARLWITTRRSWRDAALSLLAAIFGPAIVLGAALRVASFRELLFFGYRYPLRFYEWFRSSPLVRATFHFHDPFAYCSNWFRSDVAIPAIALLIILLIAEWRSMGKRRRNLMLLLIAFVLSGALEIRFLYSYPRLWPQYFVMWGCSLAAAYGVVLSSPPRRYRALTIGANLLVVAFFCANAYFELHTAVDQSHWKLKQRIMSSLLPSEGVWLDPSDCPFAAPAGSYYWYAYKDQVPFSLAYARTSEGRSWLPSLTEADLPPCRMLDANRHGLPRGAGSVRFIDERNVCSLPQSARCLADMERANFAHRINAAGVFEINRPPVRH
jgi:hypothetical protein